jgi:hypothetical protein
MKPYPFAPLNHLTVPFSFTELLLSLPTKHNVRNKAGTGEDQVLEAEQNQLTTNPVSSVSPQARISTGCGETLETGPECHAKLPTAHSLCSFTTPQHLQMREIKTLQYVPQGTPLGKQRFRHLDKNPPIWEDV